MYLVLYTVRKVYLVLFIRAARNALDGDTTTTSKYHFCFVCFPNESALNSALFAFYWMWKGVIGLQGAGFGPNFQKTFLSCSATQLKAKSKRNPFPG